MSRHGVAACAVAGSLPALGLALACVAACRHLPCLAACARCQDRCAGDEGQRTCLARCLGRACTAEEVNHCSWDGPSYGLEGGDEGADAGAP